MLGRTLRRAWEVLQEQTDLGQRPFRSVRRLARQVGEAMRKRGETAWEQGLQAYRKLDKATQQTIEQAQQVLPAWQAMTSKEADRTTEVLETFIPRAGQVVSQTVRRVFQGEKVIASEKIVSLFEPHTDIICRNKARKRTEYGHKVWLDEVDGGIVTRWQVLEGNPNDDQQWLRQKLAVDRV